MSPVERAAVPRMRVGEGTPCRTSGRCPTRGLWAEGRGTPSAGDTPSWGSGAAPAGSSVRTRRPGSSVTGRLGRCMSVQPAWPGSAPIVAAVAHLRPGHHGTTRHRGCGQFRPVPSTKVWRVERVARRAASTNRRARTKPMTPAPTPQSAASTRDGLAESAVQPLRAHFGLAVLLASSS